MKKSMINVIIFAAGAAIGSLVTWKVVKTKYDEILNECQSELDNLCETVDRLVDLKKDVPDTKEIKSSETMYAVELGEKLEEYLDILNEESYLGKGADGMSLDKPYVISPDDFDELDDYDVMSLTYYEDGILADDYGNIIQDVDDMVGLESLQTFGLYEDDSVFVRNPKYKTDYEILMDMSTYDDAMKLRPPYMGE